MSARIRAHLRSNVIGYICLFWLMAGSAFAAQRLATTAPKNSVVSRSIKNGQVKTSDLADQAVTAAKVKDGSLTSQQIDESTLSGVPGPPTGPASGALAGTYPSPTLAAPPAWSALDLTGTNYTSAGGGQFSYASPGCYKDLEGVVHLHGRLLHATAGASVAVLPAACQPEHAVEVVGTALDSMEAGTGAAILFIGDANGDGVTAGGLSVDAGGPPVNGYLTLDGISYRASG